MIKAQPGAFSASRSSAAVDRHGLKATPIMITARSRD